MNKHSKRKFWAQSINLLYIFTIKNAQIHAMHWIPSTLQAISIAWARACSSYRLHLHGSYYSCAKSGLTGSMRQKQNVLITMIFYRMLGHIHTKISAQFWKRYIYIWYSANWLTFFFFSPFYVMICIFECITSSALNEVKCQRLAIWFFFLSFWCACNKSYWMNCFSLFNPLGSLPFG